MRSLVIGTAGHIDHGKSTLVRALTGIDPDRLQEEKARGITIDLGFAHLESEGFRFSFVDVPGHERFVKNMLAGVTGIDVVVLVVAADESVKPQTREHFDICRLLDVRHGLVALTKADLADEDTIELVALEVRDLVRGSFLDGAPVVPVSSVSGRGLGDLRAALAAVGARVPVRPGSGVARLPIDRVFSVKGFGTVVTGTLVAGQLDVDDDLVLLPGERRVKVRGLQAHGQPLAHAGAGQRLAVNLAGIDIEGIRRGDTLTRPGAVSETRVIDVAVHLLGSAKPLEHGARVRVHAGTVELLGRVALSGVEAPAADAGRGPLSGAERIAEVPPGRRAHARLRLEAPMAVTRGDRFILRAYSPPVTIAGGIVLDPAPSRGPIRTAAGRARFGAIDLRGADGETERFIEQAVSERGAAGLSRAALVSRAGLDPQAVSAVVDRLVATGRITALGEVLVPAAVLSVLASRLVDLVRAYHEQQPLSEGLPREEARSRAFARADQAVFERVVADVVAARRLAGKDRLALADRRPPLSDQDRRAMDLVASAFERGGLAPPDASGLAAALGLPRPAVEQALTLLVRQKTLVRVESLVFHAGALDRLKSDIRALKGTPAGQRLDVAAVKDRYGLSRKFAIPLLEFLDRERVTRRTGDARLVL
jgi:selenocysteine-specific elongation factor